MNQMREYVLRAALAQEVKIAPHIQMQFKRS
jgi:hypothetical protein